VCVKRCLNGTKETSQRDLDCDMKSLQSSSSSSHTHTHTPHEDRFVEAGFHEHIFLVYGAQARRKLIQEACRRWVGEEREGGRAGGREARRPREI
jgi:hypothetical protein